MARSRFFPSARGRMLEQGHSLPLSRVLVLCLLAGSAFLPTRASQARPLAPGISTGLVLNELDYVQPAAGRGVDFVELLNAGTQALSMAGHRLATVDSQGIELVGYDLPAFTLAPGEYFVVCGMPFVPNCDWVAADGEDILPGLGDGSSAFAVGLLTTPLRGGPAQLLDSVSYEGSVPGGPPGGGAWTEGDGVNPADSVDGEPFLGISRLPDGRDTDKNSGDFKPACATPGQKNSSVSANCQAPPQLRSLVVNEADIDQRGTDTEEFVELKNISTRPVDLGRFSLLGIDGNSGVYRRVDLPGQMLPPGGYYLICPASGQVANCDLAIQPITEQWHGIEPDQLPAAIALVKRDTMQQDLDILVDSLSYGTTVVGGPTAGGSWTEGSAASPADNLGLGSLGLSRNPDGGDTEDNLKDFKLRCVTPGQANGGLVTGCVRPPQLPGLVVNELDYAQNGPDTEEFVELKNRSGQPIDLGRHDLLLLDDKGNAYSRMDLDPRLLPPNGYHVVCNLGSAMVNCDQYALLEKDGLRDRDAGQPLAAVAILRDPTTDPRDDILVDSVSYEGDVPGGPDTGGTWVEGSGASVLDPAANPFVSIARLVDGIDTQSNKSDFKQGCSSPGYVNSPRPQTGAPCDGPVQVTATPSPTTAASDTPIPSRTPLPSATPTASTSPTPPATSTPGAGDPPTKTPLPSASPATNERAYKVDASANAPDQAPGDGVCLDRNNACSLQAALQEVNADKRPGAIRIHFADGLGPITIPSGLSLPPLGRDAVILDGANTFTGASPARDASPAQTTSSCLAAQALTGPGSGVGLTISSGQVAVMGLRISGFDTGVLATSAAAGLRIGSDGDGARDEAECNAIWDNRAAQVQIDGARQVWVTGNHIGIQADGEPGALARTGVGVQIGGGATANLVGTLAGRAPKPGRRNRIQNLDAGILVTGRTTEGNAIAGNLIGPAASGRWERYANVTGIRLESAARGTLIGGTADGADAPELANAILYNLRDGILLERGVQDTSIRGNEIRANRRDGVRTGTTKGVGNTLRGNRITANGGAAIAVEALALELAPPNIEWVDRVRGQVGGTTCGGCVVELFSDPLDEARKLLGRSTAMADGQWSVAGLDLLAITDPGLTATTTENGSSSRLSEVRHLADPWRLIEIPFGSPRALRPGEPVFERRFRLVDSKGVGQPFATVRFSPLNLFFLTDGRGLLTVEIPMQSLLTYGTRVMSFTVEAVDRDGMIHSVFWNPRLVLAWQQATSRLGDAVLDLSSLLPNGIGGILRRSKALGILQQTLAPLGVDGPFAATGPTGRYQSGTDGYGAAYAASPSSELREGQYAWQMNLAQGGGVYEIHPAAEPLAGLLEITAPSAAFNDGSGTGGDQRSSACPAGTQGATIAGWKGDQGCWTPIIGSSAVAPAAGAQTFKANAQVSVSSAALSLDRLDPSRALQATTAITLYTVGFDLGKPLVQWRLAAGTAIRNLPASIAEISDGLAGVDSGSISLKLGGQTVAAVFDPNTLELRIPPEGRTPPVGMTGPTTLELRVSDGFCNQTTATLSVTIDPQAPPSQAGLVIYTPYTAKAHSIK